MLIATLTQIIEIVGGKLLSNVICDQDTFIISTDSRTLKEKEIFIALKGPNFNGNLFINQAIERGAALVIIDEILDKKIILESKVPIILVKNGTVAYGKLANYYRNHQLKNCKVIGITGSIGKTTTKNLLGFVLQNIFNSSYSSKANLNNQIGIPQNILQIPKECEVAVLEMGMQRAGEIEHLGQVAEPDIAVITNVSSSHLEFFEDLKGIALAKSEIFDHMKDDGWAIVNLNTNYGEILFQQAQLKTNNIVTYSIDNSLDADIKIDNYIINSDNSCNIYVEIKNYDKFEYKLPLATRSLIENSLVVLCVGRILNLDFSSMKRAFEKFPLDHMEGRGRLINRIWRDKKITIIDDSYNAGLDAMKESLINLVKLPFQNHNIKRRIAFLGEMRELGADSSKLHLELLQYLEKVDKIATVGGEEILELNHSIQSDKNLGHFDNVDQLIASMDRIIEYGDLILIKGGNGNKLWKIIDYLK